MTERLTIAEFLIRYPDIFWIIVHVGWGAIYAAISVSLIFTAVLSARYIKEVPSAKLPVFFVQLIWSALNLAGVFSIPILIGTIDKDILISGAFVPYWLVSWAAILVISWWLFQKKFKLSDLM